MWPLAITSTSHKVICYCVFFWRYFFQTCTVLLSLHFLMWDEMCNQWLMFLIIVNNDYLQISTHLIIFFVFWQFTQGEFVAAFAQSNEGDVSPNTKGPHCMDTGKPCDVPTSTCNGRASRMKEEWIENSQIKITVFDPLH